MKRQSTKKRNGISPTTFLSRHRWWIKKCWMLLAVLMLVMAIVFSLFRALTPWAKQYKGTVEQHLSKLMGQPVLINSMETSWYWFEPVLKLNQVTISDGQTSVLKFGKLLVGINLLSSLFHWHIQPGILYIDDVHLTLRQMENHWEIDGLLHRNKQEMSFDEDVYLPILSWLFGQQKIILKNVSALVYLKDGSLLPFSAINVAAVNHDGHCRLKGKMELAQTTPTELTVLADLKLNPSAPMKVSGQVYLSIRHFLLTQWQGFLPKTGYTLEGGKGHLELWFDLAKGHMTRFQSRLNFHHIAWSKEGTRLTQFIQSLQANLAWVLTEKAWQLSGDQIQLRLNGQQWPENSFQWTHELAHQSDHFFVKNLLIEPVLALNVEWPESMALILALHPRGYLQDAQIEVKEGKMAHLLTRFFDMSWQRQNNIPAVSHLSGVVNWQPTEGRVEFDGENTTLKPLTSPLLTFNEANAAFVWKKNDDHLSIGIERLILSRPDFLFTVNGLVDDPFSASSRHVQLTATFSADHAKQWLAYVPLPSTKPKLDHWLKHDIKRIDNVSGQLTLKGAWADFPFDKAPGEFSIVSHLQGVDLYFNREWPISRRIDAYLSVNKRTLEANILKASLFKDIEADQVHLLLENMGLDKDTLLIHGKARAPSNQAIAYIMASPLQKHLTKLKKMDFKGFLGLDLNLEVPLYPENNEVLARGAVTFDDNQTTFQQVLSNLQLDHLVGTLFFNESGVTESELHAVFLGDPLLMHLNAVKQPTPSTDISIQGHTSFPKLSKKFNLTVAPFIQGEFDFYGQLKLTEVPNAFDHIQLGTSLEGVKVDLPEPFKKPAEAPVPFLLDLDVNSEKGLRLQLSYKDRLNTNLWFSSSKNEYLLESGQIRIGNSQHLLQKNSGVQIVGILPTFSYDEWHRVFSQMSGGSTTPALPHLQHINMKFGHMLIGGEDYPDLSIMANKINDEAWAFTLEQPNIAGHLRYEFSSHKLSGQMERLYLTNSLWSHRTSASSLKPIDIPNLEVTIHQLKLDKRELGQVVLKSKSKEDQWHLESCKITTPAYELNVEGDWKQNGSKNNTDLKGYLKINNLVEVLNSLQITPAVEAHQVTIQFGGGWPGAIHEFSLPHVVADIYMEFKDGRITHLSPETEEKLGLGKLLSILSLQTIPRRLKLDFSDLSNGGYSFDIFKGNFTLKKGVMNTSDSYLDGPVAYASMKGNLDVVRHLYDVELHISPHITASLPVVATIAGGPIAGAAAWVASKIINQGMQKVTGYTYRISGPWGEPVVRQESIFKKTIPPQ